MRIILLLLSGFILPAGLFAGEIETRITSYMERILDYRPFTVTTIHSADGKVLARLYREKRIFIPLSSLKSYTVGAFLAAEDHDFFDHDGIDVVSLARALVKNIESGRFSQGGSTITQQLVKVRMLIPEKSLLRKVKEAIISTALEKRMKKNRILEVYLNDIYLGQGAYGVEAAALTYFSKHARNLTLAESALIAGLPRAPSLLNPYRNREGAKRWRNHVLCKMLNLGWIDRSEYEKAVMEPVRLRMWSGFSERIDDYYTDEVRRRLVAMAEKGLIKDPLLPKGLRGEDLIKAAGWHVYSAMDPLHQKIAQEALSSGIKRLEKHAKGDVQGAIISMDPGSGRVLALVGGEGFSKSEFNRATMSLRQPGSLFKPIVYSAAIDRGYTASSIIYDAPWHYRRGKDSPAWVPKNFTGKYYGPVTLKTALAHSMNVATAKLAVKIGIGKIVAHAKRLGIRRRLLKVPSISLGSVPVTLMEMMRVYSVFARDGTGVEPWLVMRIKNRRQETVYSANQKPYRAVSRENAGIIDEMLKEAVRTGTGRPAAIPGRSVAGKTGTTNDSRDAWFVGYTPYLLTGVWVGIEKRGTLGKDATGSTAACPIWADYRGGVEPRYKSKADFSGD